MRVNPFNGYKYLIYRIYDWQKSLFGEKENPRFTAILVVSMFQMFNVMTIDLLIRYFFGFGIADAALAVIVLIAVNSFYFLYLGKFERLIAAFSNEPETSRRRNTRYCWFYIVLTHSFFFLLGSIVIGRFF